MVKIIGAGLCRTGTTSTVVALDSLGLGPVYHYNELIVRNLMDKWMQFCDGNREPILSDLKNHGYQSTLDLPMICFFDDIMKEFPDAKVLLTVRDSPKAWVKSFRNTVWQILVLPYYCGVNVLLGGSIGGQCKVRRNKKLYDFLFQTICEKGNSVSKNKVTWDSWTVTDAELEIFYENWIMYVKNKVPKDQLLIFNAKDGIEPLARFCGKSAPTLKMPHANNGGQFNLRKRVMERMAQVTIFLILLGLVGVVMGSATLMISALTGFLVIRSSADKMLHWVVQEQHTSKKTE